MKSRYLFTFLIFIVPLVSAFWWGKYGSYIEAMQACVNWKQNGLSETNQIEKKKWQNTYEREKEASRRLKIRMAKKKSQNSFYDPTESVEKRFILHEMAEEFITVDVVEYSRDCIHETRTSQFLGIEGKLNVRKHFRY